MGYVLVMTVWSPLQILKKKNHFDRDKLQVCIYAMCVSGSALKIEDNSWKNIKFYSEVTE